MHIDVQSANPRPHTFTQKPVPAVPPVSNTTDGSSLFQTFHRFVAFITGMRPFQMFQSFNRFAPFKSFQADLGGRAMDREVLEIDGTYACTSPVKLTLAI